MIDAINKHLQAMGSRFSTDDGYHLVLHLGKLTFLRKIFETPQSMSTYIGSVSEKLMHPVSREKEG